MQSGQTPSVIAWDRETRSWVSTRQWTWTYDSSVPQGQHSYRGATPVYSGPSRKKDLSALNGGKGIATYALNAGQGIASLGDSIPILFGKRTNTSGGLVAVPDAVYMRMHSAGVYQWLRAAFVIGEGSKQLGVPVERGVRLGRKTLDVLDDNYYSFGTTTGATKDNDPTVSIGTQGFFKAASDLTGADEYLGGTINQGEVRCFSQTFSSSESFGFSGEEPDCDAAEFGEIATTSITAVPLNSVKAFVSNTRSCEVTEVGLSISLNATGPDKDGIAGPGTLWVDQYSNVFRITSIAAYISNVYPAYFRKDLNLNISLDAVFGRFQQEWDDGRRFFVELDPVTMIPVDGFINSSRNFINQIGSSYFPYTGDNRNRNTSSATGYALAIPNPCTPPNFTALLSDPNNPKMAFEIYWRDAKVAGNAWRLLTSKPLIVVTADSTTMFSGLKIQHPSLSAVQFKFEPIKPDDFATNHMQFNSALLNNRISHQAQSAGSFPIIYGRNTSDITVSGNDGFEMTFKGGFAPFTGDVTLDDKSVNYAVGISYINEVIQDSPDYPFMSMALLNIRGFKGMSSLSQMSIYYDDGAQIRLLETSADGTSNMFPELANYLLTTFPGTTAGAVASTAIDTASFLKAITFTRSKGLFFDGVIQDKSGAFEFIANYAPYFLLNFGMDQGKYAFSIATQDSSTGTGTATAAQNLTLDDIVADSYQVQYATLQDREDAIVNVTYRFQERYMLGESRTVSVAPANYTGAKIIATDLSDFCTSENHAVTYARFILASRLKRTHTVNFTTFLGRIDLSPGRLFTFDFTVTASTGKTYKNNSQYQIVSAFYRADGLVDVEAIEMPTNFATLVFGNTFKVVT